MEAFIVLLILTIIVAPLLLSIIAIVKVGSLKEELSQLRRQLKTSATDDITLPIKPRPATAQPTQSKNLPIETFEESEKEVRSPQVPQKWKKAPPSPEKLKMGVEFMMGGKAAAFVGIGILIVGIALLVGYAIQHSWIGPGTRTLLGLSSGGILVWIGYMAECKDKKFRLLARVLTGGGSSLFYFSVFAAYGMFHLIGPVFAGVGLLACATAVFGLAMSYRSQSVGVLGVLGAFGTPLLITENIDLEIFSLTYVTLVNIPVILLGLRRKWQLLYNLAFCCTVIHYFVWFLDKGEQNLTIGLTFASIYFIQFAGLGLLKLHHEKQVDGRELDMLRLVLISLLLLGAVYGLFTESGLTQWLGSAFLGYSILHLAFAYLAFRRFSKFSGEIITFLIGGLVFASLVLPAQLDGEWVSIGWAIEGVIIAWYAVRIKSPIIQIAAFLLGFTGIMKAMVFDVSLYENPPFLFFNTRFIVGLLSAILMGVQGFIFKSFSKDETSQKWQDPLWWLAIITAIVFFYSDVFWTMGAENELSWLMTSLILFISGIALLLIAPKSSSVTILGSLFILLLPIKLLVIDAWIGNQIGGCNLSPFLNTVFWVQLLMPLILILFYTKIGSREVHLLIKSKQTFSLTINILSIGSFIGIISTEMLRIHSSWGEFSVTIFWAISALTLILFGMKYKIAAHRYFGLGLFTLTSLKVLVMDSSELQGLERIFAFIGTGLLLLVLSFVYQKAIYYFQSLNNKI